MTTTVFMNASPTLSDETRRDPRRLTRCTIRRCVWVEGADLLRQHRSHGRARRVAWPFRGVLRPSPCGNRDSRPRCARPGWLRRKRRVNEMLQRVECRPPSVPHEAPHCPSPSITIRVPSSIGSTDTSSRQPHGRRHRRPRTRSSVRIQIVRHVVQRFHWVLTAREMRSQPFFVEPFADFAALDQALRRAGARS